MNLKSLCCSASITEGHRQEYPLGGRAHAVTYKVDICESCGGIADPAEACDVCGEQADRFFKVDGDDFCPFCFNEKLDATVQELKERTGLGA